MRLLRIGVYAPNDASPFLFDSVVFIIHQNAPKICKTGKTNVLFCSLSELH